MDIIQLVENLSFDMYERLKHAAETGKWPEGTPVDKPQRDTAIQIVMAYQAKNLNSDENMTIGSDGNIINKSKRELKAQFSQAKKADDNQNNSTDSIARFSNL